MQVFEHHFSFNCRPRSVFNNMEAYSYSFYSGKVSDDFSPFYFSHKVSNSMVFMPTESHTYITCNGSIDIYVIGGASPHT